MAGRSVFLAHPSSLEHDPGPHPEQAARITAIERELESRGWLGYERVPSAPVERDVLEAVHPAGYVQMLSDICSRGGGSIDLDTVLSARSLDAAVHGSGGAVQLAQMLGTGAAATGFSVHRPPGHHALPRRAMGFCLFNHVAVAARYAVDVMGLERVMIFDWDVHHGNGTEAIFQEEDRVLFVSVHQWPLYPGSGAASDVGAGRGLGFTVNLPVPGGSGDVEYRSLVDGVVVPLVRLYEPQLLLISAGFDAHGEDPLAGCEVSDAGFGAMAGSLAAQAAELAIPVGAVLEGGYALGALARSVAATMAALAQPPALTDRRPAPDTALAAAARRQLSRWWRF